MCSNEVEKMMKEAVIEVAKDRSKEIYDDALKPVVRESGEVLGTVMGFVNNVIFYPLKKGSMTFKYKLEMFEQDLKEKLIDIPEDKIIEPPLNVLGPTLEALKYNFDEDELREMFLNLLSKSMNSDLKNKVHPSYVEIIKSMSTLDAIVMKKISVDRMLASSEVLFICDEGSFNGGMPRNFISKLYGIGEPFEVSSSIDNLIRLGLISKSSNGMVNYDYDEIKSHEFVISRLKLSDNILRGENSKLVLEIKINQKSISINDFGVNFRNVCMD